MSWFRTRWQHLRAKEGSNKKLVFILIALTGFWGTMHFGTDYYQQHGEYVIGRSPPEHNCLPWSWFLIKKSPPDPLYRGQIILYQAKDIPLFDENTPMVKYAAALAGDEVLIKDDKIYINNVFWGDLSLNKTLKKPPGAFDRHYTLETGQVLVLGTTPNSYDSRYWGPIKKTQITGRAYALF